MCSVTYESCRVIASFSFEIDLSDRSHLAWPEESGSSIFVLLRLEGRLWRTGEGRKHPRFVDFSVAQAQMVLPR